jgi:cell division protease FtsH
MLTKPYSEATAEKIDREVSKIVEQAYERTKAILRQHREELDELAHLLLEKEVVMKDDLERIFGKRPVTTPAHGHDDQAS